MRIAQDAAYGLRTFLRSPGFTSAVILTLALAIGGSTAMFTVIRAVLLNPLPYHNAARIISLASGVTPTLFLEMKNRTRSFDELSAFVGPENLALSGGGEPEVIKAVRVSAGFLKVADARPILGRGFQTAEDAPGAVPVAMIGKELWERRFASNPAIAGKSVVMDSIPYTIIGVLPARFRFPLPDIDVWLTAPTEEPLINARSRELSPYLSIFGRLRPGVSIGEADVEIKVIRRQYALAHPTMLDAKPKPLEITPMKDGLVSKVRSALWMLLGAVGLVLLIACANVAGLLMARAHSRRREFTVRSALGATRIRLVRQLLIESVLLSLAGGLLGAALAAWSLAAIPKLANLNLPRAGEIHASWMVLGYSALLSITTGILFGLAPALETSRTDLISALRTSGAAGFAAPGRAFQVFNVRNLLVVAQIALSLVLLIGSALLLESIARLKKVDVGFNPSHLLTARVTLPPSRYPNDRKRNTFYDELLVRLTASPGVRNAAAASILPMMGQPGTPVQDASQPHLPLNERPIEAIINVTPGYFRTLVIPLQRGRDFNERDRLDSQRVTIIDERTARQFWPDYPRGVDPVGQRVLIGGLTQNPAEVVGVVGAVRQGLEANHWPGAVYQPFSQGTPTSAVFAIRTAGEPSPFTKALSRHVRAVDRDETVANVETMEGLIDAQVGQRRAAVALLESFGGMALLLTVMGIYGVISYSAVQRTQEMGIRRALGAQSKDILWSMIRRALGLVSAGIILGLGAAAALTRLLGALLYGVSAQDATTFLGVALLFSGVAVIAGYVPAHRSTKIDPIAALRN